LTGECFRLNKATVQNMRKKLPFAIHIVNRLAIPSQRISINAK